MTPSERRLTSWKQIAAYLGREVRTVMRWERERALPIHRGPNRRSGVVFADMDELDAWTRGDKTPEAVVPDEVASVPTARAAIRRWSEVAATAGVVALGIGLGGWRLGVSRANDKPGSVVLTDGAVIARNADGTEKWRHEFAGEIVGPPYARITNPIESLAGDGMLAATSDAERKDTLRTRSGQLLWFDPAGKVRQSFSFEDRVEIGSRTYGAPWSISDYRLDSGQGARRIAVTAHHHEWWPSIVTILDDRWQRKGTFVHAGWVEHMRWLTDDRLAIAGFSNLKNGGMVALLDAHAMNGQSPSPRHSEFDCAGCGPDRPVRYVVMPRSEVNRASASTFNRANLSVSGGGALLVSTTEVPGATTAEANAIYEFTEELDLVHASYSDRYWEAHLELERLGKIQHSRAQCPERDGPREVLVWDRESGWTTVPTAPLRARSSPARTRP